MRDGIGAAAGVAILGLLIGSPTELPHAAPPISLEIRHVAVVDIGAGRIIPDQTVSIAGNRIVSIRRGGPYAPDARAIDGVGKYLIPGLWDMHVHVATSPESSLALGRRAREVFFPQYVASGVTGIRDMFSDCYPNCSFNNGSLDDGISLEEVNEWRRQSIAGTLVAPRIITSSPLVDGLGARWNGSLIVKDAGEGREAVRYIKRRGSDFVKVYSRLSRDAYFAIAGEAKKQNMVFAGHIPDSITAIEASDAGQKSVEHLTGILLATSTDETNLRSETLAWREDKAKMSRKEIDEKILATFSNAKADALFLRFVRNETWMCPTLTLLRGGAFLDDESFTNDARLKYLPSSFRDDWKPANDSRFKDLTAADFAFKRKRFQKYLEIVGAMHRAGVKILAGVDEPNQFCFPGFSLHDELALLVQAGLTPFEALQTATVNPAKYLNLTDSLGTIEKGKLADLVLLDANPLDDIKNTTKIRAVVFNGRYFNRQALDALLKQAEKAANP